jgi:short-subunit dehydrogenase
MKTILITGVSTGIGYGAASEFCRQGYRVIGTVRRQEDADRLQSNLGANFFPLLLDVTDSQAIATLPSEVLRITEGEGLAGLINNSGMAKSSPVQLQSMEDFRAHFEVNVLGLVSVTKALLPFLGAARNSPYRPGRIINISSVGGKIAAPFIASYVATKHAVEGFSHSLRRELMLFGVKVIIVGPGSIRTAIWKKAGAEGNNPFIGTDFEESMGRFQKYALEIEAQGATPEQMGVFLRMVFETAHPRARYAFVVGRLTNWILPRLLPDAWLDRVFGAKFALRPKS